MEQLPEREPVENPSVIKWVVLRLRFRRMGLQSFIEDTEACVLLAKRLESTLIWLGTKVSRALLPTW